MVVHSPAGPLYHRSALGFDSRGNGCPGVVIRGADVVLGCMPLEGFPRSSSLIMTITFVRPAPQERADTPLDPELKIISHLIQVTTEVGIRTDPASIVNLYVALKSKPMAILTGIAHSGKVALVRVLAQTLIGDDPWRCQMMSGHAWWAGQTGNVALFTDIQTRLNSDKVLNLLEEAGRPENARQTYIAARRPNAAITTGAARSIEASAETVSTLARCSRKPELIVVR